MNEFITILEQRKSQLTSLGFSGKSLSLHAAFLDFLWQKNQEELNIVSRKMTKLELVDKHWMDSLLALPHWPRKEALKVADLGSGGGFPAIVLAIEFREQEFFLFEKSPKKQDYLKALVRHLELTNVSIKGLVSEPLGVDLICARAFKPLPEILRLTKEHYKAGASYFLYKARLESIEKEISEAKLKFRDIDKNVKIIPLDATLLNGVEERHIVSINI